MKKIIFILNLILITPRLCFCNECLDQILRLHNLEGRVFLVDSKCQCGKKYPFYNEDDYLVGTVCVYEDGTESYYSNIERDIISYIIKVSNDTFEKHDMTFNKTSIYKIINKNLTQIYDLKGNLIGKIITKDNKKFYYDKKDNLIASGDKDKKIKATFCEYGGIPRPIYNSLNRRAYTICDNGEERTLYTVSGKFSAKLIPTNKKNTRKILNVYDRHQGYEVKEGDNSIVWYDTRRNFLVRYKLKENVVVMYNIDNKITGYLRYKK